MIEPGVSEAMLTAYEFHLMLYSLNYIISFVAAIKVNSLGPKLTNYLFSDQVKQGDVVVSLVRY